MPKDGSLMVELFAPQLSLEAGPQPLLDADGAAIIIHTGADDYTTAPAGNAGPPIACGVIRGAADKPQSSVLRGGVAAE